MAVMTRLARPRRLDDHSYHDMLNRIRGEYLEMPGMRLSSQQVRRLSGMDETTCQSVLDDLVRAAFLRLDPEGRYSRVTDGGDIPDARATRRETILQRHGQDRYMGPV
jgi:hypothetical protein